MKFHLKLSLTLLLIACAVLFSCNEDYTDSIDIHQIESILKNKHGEVIDKAKIDIMNSKNLSIITGIDYIENSKAKNGKFLAYTLDIQDHYPIIDHLKIDQKIQEYDLNIDFILLMTVEQIKQNKGPQLNNGLLRAKCVKGECIMVMGTNEESNCNPFAILPCGTPLNPTIIEIPIVDEDKADDTVDDHRPGRRF